VSYYDDEQGVCFDFTLELTPERAGDFGSVYMGGMSRTIKECLSQAAEIQEQIERHVDGIDSVSVTIVDESGRYSDMDDWQARQVIGNGWNPKWENYKDKLPSAKTPVEDKYFVLERFCKELLTNSSFQTNNPSEAEFLEEQFKEWESD